MVHFYWVPEAPDFPGVYGSIKKAGTRDPNAALKFKTIEECQDWCNKNPYPKFTPMEHGFCTGLEDFA